MTRMVIPMARKSSAIRREIKQTKGFPDRADEATVALLRTADVLRGTMERALAPMGVTLQQYNVLRILRGSHPESMPTLEIAARMVERAPGITRLLDRLEVMALVTRKRCPDDRRRVLCSITGKGLSILDEAHEPVHEAARQRVGRVSDAELVSLLELLDRIREDVK